MLDRLLEIVGLCVDLAHLEVSVAELLLALLLRLLRVFKRVRQVDLLDVLQLLDRPVEVFLFRIDLGDDGEDGSIAHVVAAEHLDVHLEAFLKQRKGILIVAGLHVALAKQGQDLRVVSLCFLDFLEKRAVQFKCGRQMI